MGIRRRKLALSLAPLVLCALPLTAQQPPREAVSAHDAGASPQDEATSYIDVPIQRLETLVPQLMGIRYESNQERLPLILANAASVIGQVLPKLPDLISREDVFHFQGKWHPSSSDEIAAAQPWSRTFSYILRRARNPDGSFTLIESRLNKKNEPIEKEHSFMAIRSHGFAYQWLFVSAANQPQSHFRYMGEQKKNGHQTFVVAFAQDPKKVADPAVLLTDIGTVSFYYQGILWIDQSSFQIVALRSDLLPPIPSAHLRQLTTELAFRSVTIRGYGIPLWLPHQVEVSTDEGRGLSSEAHSYSNYHLFHSDIKILTTPVAPSEEKKP
jgi:hypothetical protein